jgi:hypothetical protein
MISRKRLNEQIVIARLKPGDDGFCVEPPDLQ